MSALEQQGAVDQAGVHVQEEVGVERVVRQAGHRVDALDSGVDVVDPFGGGIGLRLRTERDRVREDERPLEPLPRVPLVEARLARPGDHERVRRLHQHRTRPAEQHGHLAMHLPRDAVGPEVPQVGHPTSLATSHGPVTPVIARSSRATGSAARTTRWFRALDPPT